MKFWSFCESYLQSGFPNIFLKMCISAVQYLYQTQLEIYVHVLLDACNETKTKILHLLTMEMLRDTWFASLFSC